MIMNVNITILTSNLLRVCFGSNEASELHSQSNATSNYTTKDTGGGFDINTVYETPHSGIFVDNTKHDSILKNNVILNQFENVRCDINNPKKPINRVSESSINIFRHKKLRFQQNVNLALAKQSLIQETVINAKNDHNQLNTANPRINKTFCNSVINDKNYNHVISYNENIQESSQKSNYINTIQSLNYYHMLYNQNHAVAREYNPNLKMNDTNKEPISTSDTISNKDTNIITSDTYKEYKNTIYDQKCNVLSDASSNLYYKNPDIQVSIHPQKIYPHQDIFSSLDATNKNITELHSNESTSNMNNHCDNFGEFRNASNNHTRPNLRLIEQINHNYCEQINCRDCIIFKFEDYNNCKNIITKETNNLGYNTADTKKSYTINDQNNEFYTSYYLAHRSQITPNNEDYHQRKITFNDLIENKNGIFHVNQFKLALALHSKEYDFENFDQLKNNLKQNSNIIEYPLLTKICELFMDDLTFFDLCVMRPRNISDVAFENNNLAQSILFFIIFENEIKFINLKSIEDFLSQSIFANARNCDSPIDSIIEKWYFNHKKKFIKRDKK
ncbi:hypothetical protein COBT_002282 [Conglomerata obtusa]